VRQCHGKRYNRETERSRFKGKVRIADVASMHAPLEVRRRSRFFLDEKFV